MHHLLLVLIFLSSSHAMPAAFGILYYRSSLDYFHALEDLSRDCAKVIFWTSSEFKILLYQINLNEEFVTLQYLVKKQLQIKIQPYVTGYEIKLS